VAVVILHSMIKGNLVTTEFKSEGPHEKHVEATLKGGNHLSIRSWTQGKQEKPVSRWLVAGPSGGPSELQFSSLHVSRATDKNEANKVDHYVNQITYFHLNTEL